MSTPLPLGLTPYISPVTLTTAPTGIDWTTIPPGDDITPAENEAQWWNMCARATSKVDGYINQVLRATVDVELHHGPDYRVTVGPASGGMTATPYWGTSCAQNARIMLFRWPVLQVTGVQVSPNVFPRHWQTVATGMFEPEQPPIGIYGSVAPGGSAQGGQAVLVGGNSVNWSYGRNGYAIQVSYINGYPHCSLTTAAAAGDTVLHVDDTTGWAITNYYGTYTGATGRVVDSGNQEAVHVATASVTAGPGTITLASPLHYPHQAGIIITTLPAAIEQACILMCTADALTRGATSTTVHDIAGHAQNTGGDIQGLNTEAELLLHPYRRTI